LSAETKEFGPEARVGPERTPLSEVPPLGDEENSRPVEQGPTWDYFTDSVPLRGDRYLREREERIGRLERARPRRRRRVPRLRAGLVVCAAIGLSVLARSPARTDPAQRSATRQVPAVPRVATATPRIGLAPAVVVERAKLRRFRSSAQPRRRPRRQRPVGPGSDEAPATGAAPPPEADEPQIQVESPPEPEPETPAPEPEPAEAPASPAPQPQSEPKSSSSSEADRQFGFGR
jgi:hypothetical protein